MRSLGLALFFFSLPALAGDIAAVVGVWTHTAAAVRDADAYARGLPNRIGRERQIGRATLGNSDHVYLFEIEAASLEPLARRFGKPGESGVFPVGYLMDIGVRVPPVTALTQASLEEVTRYLDTADFAQRLSMIAGACNFIYARGTPEVMAAIPQATRDAFARHLVRLLKLSAEVIEIYRAAFSERARVVMRADGVRRTAAEEELILYHALTCRQALDDRKAFSTLARAIAQALDRVNTAYATDALVRLSDACDSAPLHVVAATPASRKKFFEAWLAAARSEYGNLGRAPGVYLLAASRYQYSSVARDVLFPPVIVRELPALTDLNGMPTSFFLFEGKGESYVDPILDFVLMAEQSWLDSSAVAHGNALSDVVMSRASNVNRYLGFPRAQRDAFKATAIAFYKKILDKAKSDPLRAMAIDRALALALQLGPERPDSLVSFIYDAETHVSPSYNFPCSQLLAGNK